mgnify:CR=1 FL=1
MSKLKIIIRTDNAAFEDSADEIPGILEGLAQYYRENGTLPDSITDSNGNTCGRVLEE